MKFNSSSNQRNLGKRKHTYVEEALNAVIWRWTKSLEAQGMNKMEGGPASA